MTTTEQTTSKGKSAFTLSFELHEVPKARRSECFRDAPSQFGLALSVRDAAFHVRVPSFQ